MLNCDFLQLVLRHSKSRVLCSKWVWNILSIAVLSQGLFPFLREGDRNSMLLAYLVQSHIDFSILFFHDVDVTLKHRINIGTTLRFLKIRLFHSAFEYDFQLIKFFDVDSLCSKHKLCNIAEYVFGHAM